MVWWETVLASYTNWASFKRHSGLSIVADHLHLFMTAGNHLLMDTSNRITQYHKAQIISDWFLEYDNEFTILKWPPQSPSQPNKAPLGCAGTGDSHTLRRKGSTYQRYVFGTPKRFYRLLKKGFLWVLYRTLGFHRIFYQKKWFYIEPFWSSIYEAGDGTISGSK